MRGRDAYIRQSVRSDYCGVYSAGMLLSLMGMPTPRARARALFGLPAASRGYDGTDVDLLAKVVGDATGLRSVRWWFRRRFLFREVARALQQQLDATRLPTLLWFGSVYSDLSTRAHHIAVAVQARPDRIQLLDPLGVPPGPESSSNVSILPTRTRGLFQTEGTFYYVDPLMEVGILRWRRASRTERRMNDIRRRLSVQSALSDLSCRRQAPLAPRP